MQRGRAMCLCLQTWRALLNGTGGSETFGLPFRKAKGTILQWPLAEIYQPSSGENELDKVQGVVINPFDEHPELVDWAYFEDDSK